MSVHMRSSIESNAICQPLLAPYPNEMNVGGAERAIPSNFENSAINRDHYITISDGPEEAVFKLQELPKDLSQLVISFVEKEYRSNLRLVSKQMRESVDAYRLQLDKNYNPRLEMVIARYQARAAHEALKRLNCIRLAKRIVAVIAAPIVLPVFCAWGIIWFPCFVISSDPSAECFSYPYRALNYVGTAFFRVLAHGDPTEPVDDCC